MGIQMTEGHRILNRRVGVRPVGQRPEPDTIDNSVAAAKLDDLHRPGGGKRLAGPLGVAGIGK